MAKFSLREGEEILERAIVQTAAEGVMRNAKLILTNRRVVLIPDDKRSRWLPSGVAKLFAMTTDRISHEIRRESFGAAEPTGATSLKVRSQGEGYGMTWFEVETQRRDEWVDRLTRWAAD